MGLKIISVSLILIRNIRKKLMFYINNLLYLYQYAIMIRTVIIINQNLVIMVSLPVIYYS